MGAFLDFRLKWQYQGKSGEIKAGQESLFHRAFLNLRHELVDWAPAFQLIVEDVLEPFVEKQFQSEGAAGVDVVRSDKSSGTGLDWQELAESTKRGRAGTTILYRSGSLAKSFRKGGGEHVENITPQKLQWGSSKPYALFHQTGTGKGFGQERVETGPGTGRGMAMRKIIVLTDREKRRMSRTMTGRIAQVARQIGFGIAGHDRISAQEARRIGNIRLGLA